MSSNSKRKRRVPISRAHYRIAKSRLELEVEKMCSTVHQPNVPQDILSESQLENAMSQYPNVESLHTFDEQMHNEDEVTFPNSDSESDGEHEIFTKCNPSDTNFQSQLASWAITFNIPHVALSALLLLLKTSYDATLPCDARTLLRTPRHLSFKSIEPGKYFHVGIMKAVSKLLTFVGDIGTALKSGIKVCVNIDGLPLAKSCSSQLWPILCSLYDHVNHVELIGVYQGLDKPKESNLFLKDFVEEAVDLTNNGFNYNGKTYTFKIAAFVCDAPAKSFIKKTKGHAGYSSCTKCFTVGEFVDNRVCFPQINNLKVRSDVDFRAKMDEDHHMGTTILESIPGLNMITDFPLDYMHLICLGVMRKLLLMWVSGKPPTKLSYTKIQNISESLINQIPYTACEFARKPRSLSEVNRFKATEYRQFLLYTGPIILQSILSPNMYMNFLSLHVATVVLSSIRTLHHLGNYAHLLLQYFVKTFIHIYGKQHASHNIHHLIHLFEDTNKFGVLQNFSSFPFENYLHSLKKIIRKGDAPLVQLVKRKLEEEACKVLENSISIKYPQLSMEHNSGPLLNKNSCTQFKQIKFKNFTLKLSDADNCCCLKDGSIICVKNIILKEHELYIIGSKYLEMSDVYVQPCKSSSLGIYLVSKEAPLNIWSIKEISNKVVKVVSSDRITVFPLLH